MPYLLKILEIAQNTSIWRALIEGHMTKSNFLLRGNELSLTMIKSFFPKFSELSFRGQSPRHAARFVNHAALRSLSRTHGGFFEGIVTLQKRVLR